MSGVVLVDARARIVLRFALFFSECVPLHRAHVPLHPPITTGAFEIHHGEHLVYSGLATGRLPNLNDILDGFKRSGSELLCATSTRRTRRCSLEFVGARN